MVSRYFVVDWGKEDPITKAYEVIDEDITELIEKEKKKLKKDTYSVNEISREEYRSLMKRFIH